MDYPFLVMLDGLVALVNDATGEGGSCGRTGAVGSLDEIGLVNGEPSFLTAVLRGCARS
jgi:hypothetical protein